MSDYLVREIKKEVKSRKNYSPLSFFFDLMNSLFNGLILEKNNFNNFCDLYLIEDNYYRLFFEKMFMINPFFLRETSCASPFVSLT
jgi:hypothetical protein